jgi:cell division septum initiation protein DivIVA
LISIIKESTNYKQFTMSIISIRELQQENTALKAEREKLKADLKYQNEINQKWSSDSDIVHRMYAEIVDPLREENGKLKGDITLHPDYEILIKLTAEEDDKLKEENEKLKETLNQFEDSIKRANADQRLRIETLEDDLFGYSSSDE